MSKEIAKLLLKNFGLWRRWCWIEAGVAVVAPEPPAGVFWVKKKGQGSWTGKRRT